MGIAASLPYLERIVPTYVSAVIAALLALARLEVAASADDTSSHKVLIAVAIMPLTDMLAQRGPSGLVPLIEWMVAGGEEEH